MPILVFVLVLLAAVVIAVLVAELSFKQQITREIAALFADQSPAGSAAQTFQHSELANLPAPIAGYLRQTVPDGTPMIRTARLRQTGDFRVSQNWQAITAEQYFTTDPPGFIWVGRVQPLPVMWVIARDRYAAARGNMLIRINSLVTLDDASGAHIDQGSLLRFLAELMWLPTALLARDGLRWEAVDDQCARLHAAVGELTVALDFYFDADGDLSRVETLRYRAVDELLPWVGYTRRFGTFAGIRIPDQIEVAWRTESGEESYARLTITSLDYNTVETY